ncbi:MAG: ATP-binding protein [Deltaproteobacteria bacterium]|nr:ATP-binding protein [Deltaproteobacteria bacterium]
MKRLIYKKLQKWKESNRRKPLILRGARQTGKTYILKEFGKNEYDNYVYLNFEESSDLTDLLSNNLPVEDVLRYISLYTGNKIVPGKTLLIFDEIQEAPIILQSLKYFYEKFREHHIIAAGSLLGIVLAGKISFPVGKISFMDLYPLSFEEFLGALGQSNLLDIVPDKLDLVAPIPNVFHDKLIELLKIYYYVGGMPEVVADYISNQDFNRVREIQLELIDTYLNDFSKHTTKSEAIKIRQIWNSISVHLAKENKSFIFSAIRSSARARDYEIALQWLLDAGLIYQIKNISRPLFPLAAYVKSSFKVYLLDVGLLGAMTGLRVENIIVNDKLFSHFKGALVENFVYQEISPYTTAYYWTTDGKAEVDLVVDIKGKIYPIEVKAGINLNAKSLNIYDKLFNPDILFRSSAANFSKSQKKINIPLYAIKYFATDNQ